MKRLLFCQLFVAGVLVAMVSYAQLPSSSHEYAGTLVSNVAEVVSLSQDQISALQTAAEAYVLAAESANAQYAMNDSLLIVAKRDAWSEYQNAFRLILTEEQYNQYVRQQQTRRQELLNRIKQN